MNKRLKNIRPLVTLTLGALVPGMVTFGLAIVTQAQSETSSKPRTLPVKPVAKMIYGQMTYYEENGKFLKQMNELQNHLESAFNLTIAPDNDHDYIIRSTGRASYNYIVPKDESSTETASVGALFVPPEDSGKSKLMKIICQNQNIGPQRPADPKLIIDPLDPRNVSVECGENSFQNLTFN